MELTAWSPHPLHHRVDAAARAGKAMQPEERQRHEAQRLELDVPRCANRGEPKINCNVMRSLPVSSRANMHRQGRGHERPEESTLAEDQIGGDGVDGPERQPVAAGCRSRPACGAGKKMFASGIRR
jgi:hypothetical protein